MFGTRGDRAAVGSASPAGPTIAVFASGKHSRHRSAHSTGFAVDSWVAVRAGALARSGSLGVATVRGSDG